MIPRISIREALADRELLGNALPGPTWRTWHIMLTALMGEPLLDDELETFRSLTGRETSPDAMVREAALCVGRRGGKSRSLATLASYIGCLCSHPEIAPGEVGAVICIAMDREQASIVLKYVSGVLNESPILRGMIKSKSDDTIGLSNGIEIIARSPSFRRLRGRTAVAVIGDESAFWLGEDRSSNPDKEIVNAVRPSLLTTGGPMLLASSVYRRAGILYEFWRRDHGPSGDPRTLCALGTSMDFNPSLPQEEIDRELAKDYEAASAEYLSRWRDDITDFVSREIVELAVEPGVIERPFQMGATYFAFVDVAGGSGSDSYALAIGHRHGGRVMIDAVRETRPPFSPRDVTREYASLVAKYRIRTVTGDRYGGDWPGEAWREHGIRYKVSERSKSEIYADLLPLLNGGDLVLLDHARCNAQIASLERRARWGGKSSIDHPMRAHDDVANAVAGCAVHVKSNRAAAREWEQAERPQQVILGYASTKRAAASIPASKPKGRPFTHNDIDPNPPAAPETHFVGNLGHRIVATETNGDGRIWWRLYDGRGQRHGLVLGREAAVAAAEQLVREGVMAR